MKNIFPRLRHFIIGIFLLTGLQAGAQQLPMAELVKDINAGPFNSGIEFLTKLSQTTALFFAEDEYYGRELWKTDGTPAGTLMVKDIFPGKTSSYKNLDNYYHCQPIVLNGLFYFVADDGSSGRQVWRSDGTTNGTFPVTVRLGLRGNVSHFTPYKDELYFSAQDGNGCSLFKTRGTESTTVRVKPFPTAGNDLGKLVFFKDELYFLVNQNGQGMTLFKTNGSPAGTVRVGPELAYGAKILGATPDLLYFNSNRGLWKSDGTIKATQLVREMYLHSDLGAVPSGGYIYFMTTERANYFRLWRSDGNLTGTMALTGEELDLSYGILKDRIYFVYKSKKNDHPGKELWTTSGAPETTGAVSEKFTGLNPTYITEADGKLYYYAGMRPSDRWEHGRAIWESDGTPEGTRLVGALGRRISTPKFAAQKRKPLDLTGTFETNAFVKLGNRLLFIAQDNPADGSETKGVELYRLELLPMRKSAQSLPATPPKTTNRPSTNQQTYPYKMREIKREYRSKNTSGSGSGYASFTIPEFEDAALNQLIRQKLVGNSTYEKVAEENIYIYADYTAKVTVEKQTPTLLLLKNDFSWYGEGAAHGNYSEKYWLYHKQRKIFLTPSDLFTYSGQIELKSLAESTFRRIEKLTPSASLCKNYLFDKCRFEVAKEFRFDDKSFTYVYNPYEGKSFAAGIWTLPLPYDKVFPSMKPEYAKLIREEWLKPAAGF